LLSGDKTKEGLHGSYYSELYNYRYVAENYALPDYIGFCGYRKYFAFLDDISEDKIKRLVDSHGCITGELADFKSMSAYENYAYNHNREDMELMKAVIIDLYPQFYPAFMNFLFQNKMYTCNMFIMKKEDFQIMMKFIFSILDEFTRRLGPANIENHVVDAFRRGLLRLGTVKHQSRIGGYIGERLVSAYIMKNFPDAYIGGLKITGNRIR